MGLEDKLREAFQRFNSITDEMKVEFAYLFGSTPLGLSRPTSDIDIAVYLNIKPSLDNELNLHLFLVREMKTDEIDLVVLNTAKNIMLMDEIVRKGIVVYDGNPSLREKFELSVIHQGIDFKEQRKVLIGR